MEVIGCDVGKDFIIIHDGKSWKKIKDNEKIEDMKGKIIVLEQTGMYGIRWAEKFIEAGAYVRIADGKQFKRFRTAFDRRKDDYIDAYYLREFYISETHRRYTYEYSIKDKILRTYIRQWIRENKDLTKSLNRLRQYLAVIFTHTNHHTMTRYKLLKEIDTIIKELKTTPHALSTTAIYEAQKVKLIAKHINELKVEIESIARNHKDYEILSTIPGVSDIMIATLIAYYWDIRRFKDKKGFIGYTLIGATHEQSGKSIKIKKTDRTRTEIKGIWYMHFMRAHREDSELKKLTEYLKAQYKDYKKRYIKYMDYLLEIIYIMLKNRITFKEALLIRIQAQQREIDSIKKKKQLETKDTYKMHKTLERLEVCRDIFTNLNGEVANLLPQNIPKKNKLKNKKEELNGKNTNSTNDNNSTDYNYDNDNTHNTSTTADTTISKQNKHRNISSNKRKRRKI